MTNLVSGQRNALISLITSSSLHFKFCVQLLLPSKRKKNFIWVASTIVRARCSESSNHVLYRVYHNCWSTRTNMNMCVYVYERIDIPKSICRNVASLVIPMIWIELCSIVLLQILFTFVKSGSTNKSLTRYVVLLRARFLRLIYQWPWECNSPALLIAVILR